MTRHLLDGAISIALAHVLAPLSAQDAHDHAAHAAMPSYVVDDVPLPLDVAPEVGGLAFGPDGSLYVALRRHGILRGTPSPGDARRFDWRAFATTSLHNPMGIAVLGDGDLLVPQMPELTRVTDVDGDGRADRYATVSTGWGVSGNYHETNAGPVGDGDGGWFVAVGTASFNGPTFDRVRGRYSEIGRRGRNFSAVDWKGWVVRITPGGEVVPFAGGFRANNGIVRSPTGDLFVTDNQGDWRGTSPLYHIVEGGFYGHPSSLVWAPDWPGDDPLKRPLADLDAARTPAAVQFPHGDYCNSPSEPVFVAGAAGGDTFGPFDGQLLVGDIAGARVLRVCLEQVDGVWQGACTSLVAGGALRGGTNRLCFSPDGASLYVGQTFRGWGEPAEGLQRITFTGHAPFAIRTMRLTRDGFELDLTRPAAAGTAVPTSFALKRYRFDYGHRYGSPKRDVTALAITAVDVVAPDRLRLRLAESLVAGHLYDLDATGLRAAVGNRALDHARICYTANRLVP